MQVDCPRILASALATDGHGDCEDYALLKRKLLLQAARPRPALLITVARDRNGDGHAVLTVKRQSQGDPNLWLGDPRPAIATATAR